MAVPDLPLLREVLGRESLGEIVTPVRPSPRQSLAVLLGNIWSTCENSVNTRLMRRLGMPYWVKAWQLGLQMPTYRPSRSRTDLYVSSCAQLSNRDHLMAALW